MKPEVWPYRVGVRRFRPKRLGNNWAAQSAQTGGNVQAGESQGGPQYSHGGRRQYNQNGYYQQQGGGAYQYGHGGGGGGHGNQYAPSAPVPVFHLQTDNRYSGLKDNVDN